MALPLLILTVASLLAKVAVAQFNFNPYNSAYSSLYSNSQLQYPYNSGINTYPYPNSYNSNNNLYQGSSLYSNSGSSLYSNTGSGLYPNTNLYGTGTTNQMYLSSGYNNPANIYNTNSQLFNPYSVSAGNTIPGTQNPGSPCQYRPFQGCVAPQSSGCRQCVEAGYGTCQCVGFTGFVGK